MQATTSIDLGSEATLPSASGLIAGALQNSGEASVNASYQSANKTERVTGVVALAALVVALSLVAIALYALLSR